MVDFNKFTSFNSREPRTNKAIEPTEGKPATSAYNKAIIKTIVNNLRNLPDPPKVES
jgi:hypothetical protein